MFHARFTEYAYPMHVHDAWTLLIVDDGAVRLRPQTGTEHGTRTTPCPCCAARPPQRASRHPGGFRKRCAVPRRRHLADGLIGAAVDRPICAIPCLRLVGASAGARRARAAPGRCWRPRAADARRVG
ncbi:hypothetical protein GCM10023238_24090 [Streptomyces heliomycini]